MPCIARVTRSRMSSSYTVEFNKLVTEERNPRTMDLDLLTTEDLVRRVQEEDIEVAKAVERAVPQIAKAVDLIAQKMNDGGRIIYIGAGTSCRLGVLDATECPLTFGDPYDLIQA